MRNHNEEDAGSSFVYSHFTQIPRGTNYYEQVRRALRQPNARNFTFPRNHRDTHHRLFHRWGGYFESDGNLRGDQFTDVVPCTNGVCAIKVKAPGVAVVFLTDDLIFDAKADPPASTYATTRTTKMMNTAAIPGAALHTNNGVNGEWRFVALTHVRVCRLLAYTILQAETPWKHEPQATV